MKNKFFKKHQGRGSYDLFSNYNHFTPGVKGTFGLFGLFLLGGILGNLVLLAMQAVLPEVAKEYGTLVSYPMMFIPAMLYASAKSRIDENFTPAVPVDSNNFGRLGGFAMAVIVSVATIAAYARISGRGNEAAPECAAMDNSHLCVGVRTIL